MLNGKIFKILSEKSPEQILIDHNIALYRCTGLPTVFTCDRVHKYISDNFKDVKIDFHMIYKLPASLITRNKHVGYGTPTYHIENKEITQQVFDLLDFRGKIINTKDMNPRIVACKQDRTYKMVLRFNPCESIELMEVTPKNLEILVGLSSNLRDYWITAVIHKEIYVNKYPHKPERYEKTRTKHVYRNSYHKTQMENLVNDFLKQKINHDV